jgi:hypothetical protein
MSASRNRILAASLALSLIVGSTMPALAQPTDSKVLAGQLFEQARDLAKAGKWAEACPIFEASLRYDAALGTRLNLATCYEKTGRLATAWALFRDVAGLARGAGDSARERYALEQATALQPRLPRLLIAGPTNPPTGLTVQRDGQPFDLATLGTPLYVDPGLHEVTASAPGFEPFKATITVDEGKIESVVIRKLTPDKAQAAAPPPQRADSKPPASRPASGRTRKLIALGLAGGGVLLAGTGLVFGIRARSTYADARALCGASLMCETDESFETGKDLIEQARTQAATSSALVLVGVAVAAAGTVVWVTARKPAPTETAVVPLVSGRELGAVIMGKF